MTQSNPLSTALTERMGIAYPVCQAGMGFIARGELAAAVSAAGGLGVIGAEGLSADELAAEIVKVRALTDRPFGVDILFGQVKSERSDAVAEYSTQVQQQIDVVLEARVPVLISGLGSPAGVLDAAHARGMTVMSVIGNVRQARRLAAAGVDLLIAQGHEAGGHTGRIGSFRCWRPVASATGAGWWQRWRWAPAACGWARALSPLQKPTRTRPTSSASWPSTRKARSSPAPTAASRAGW